VARVRRGAGVGRVAVVLERHVPDARDSAVAAVRPEPRPPAHDVPEDLDGRGLEAICLHQLDDLRSFKVARWQP
jgi:hypothetical protein